MSPFVRRRAAEGTWLGLIAGLVMLAAEVIASAIAGADQPLSVLRLHASVALGRVAVAGVALPVVAAFGLAAHLALSAGFGLAYGIANGRLTALHRCSRIRQAAVGAAFGLALWVLDLQLIARAFYPWLLDSPAGATLALHAFAFGLPLGIMFAAAERRGPRLMLVPRAA